MLSHSHEISHSQSSNHLQRIHSQLLSAAMKSQLFLSKNSSYHSVRIQRAIRKIRFKREELAEEEEEEEAAALEVCTLYELVYFANSNVRPRRGCRKSFPPLIGYPEDETGSRFASPKNRSALSSTAASCGVSPGRRQLPRDPWRDSQRCLTKTSSDSRPYTPSSSASFSPSPLPLAAPLPRRLSPFPPSRARETVPPRRRHHPRTATSPHSYYVTIKSSRFSKTISYCACRVKFRDRA